MQEAQYEILLIHFWVQRKEILACIPTSGNVFLVILHIFVRQYSLHCGFGQGFTIYLSKGRVLESGRICSKFGEWETPAKCLIVLLRTYKICLLFWQTVRSCSYHQYHHSRSTSSVFAVLSGLL